MRRIRVVIGTAVVLGLLALPAAPAMASAEERMIDRLNTIRSSQGLPALRPSNSLLASSRAYAWRMMTGGFFAHAATIPVAARFRMAGETLAWHSGRALQPRRTVGRWMRSPGHRAVLLSPRFRRIGVGHARGNFQGGAATIWVAHVGRL